MLYIISSCTIADGVRLCQSVQTGLQQFDIGW